MSNYKIAIPSYKRPKTLNNKTLKLLNKYNINPKKITIFVANQDEKNIYNDYLDKKYKIIIGKEGIKNIRNFMADYFEENDKIFYLDDDISYIYEVYNKISNDRKYNKLKEIDDLHKLILTGFKLCEKYNLSNWGIYPVENPYFLKLKTNNLNDYISFKLNYIMGGFTGVINNKKCEKRTVNDKEDYERSIKYYLKDNGLIRFNNICCRTNCYKEPGGMQVKRTLDKIHKSAVKINKNYPNLCSLNTTKKSGITELRLRDKRQKF